MKTTGNHSIIRHIARTELQSLFYSPVAWLILIVFSFQCSQLMLRIAESLAVQKAMNYTLGNLTTFALSGQIGFFRELQSYLYLYIPLLTMGLMSSEYASGSIRLLYSSPVRNREIILGKYVAMMVFGAAMLGIVALYTLYAAVIIELFDVAAALSGLLGLYLLICTYAAIGLFMSCITSYQVVAAVGTLVLLAALRYLRYVGQSVDFVRDITYWLSIDGRCDEFIRGLICSEDLVYFLLVIALFLVLAVNWLGDVRQKSDKRRAVWRYAAILVVTVGVGYLTSRPSMKCFWDVTRTRQQTLTPNSQRIVSQLDGPIVMTTYVNVLDDFRWAALPSNKINDQLHFEQYTRFCPDMEFRYVYYYNHSTDSRLYGRYPGLSDREIMIKEATAQRLDTAQILAPAQIDARIDLSSEQYRVVRTVETPNGRKAFLRMFDDMWIYPGEAETSASLKQLIDGGVRTGFLGGHGERDFERDGDRNLRYFSAERNYRHALINQGFVPRRVTACDRDLDACSILVIADPLDAFSEEELAALRRYIDHGGNLFVAGDAPRQTLLEPLLEPLGVRMSRGLVVAPQEDYSYDFVLARTAGGEVVTMPSATGLEILPDCRFRVDTLLTSAPDGWLELRTTDFVAEQPRFEPEAGERLGAMPLGVRLSRTVDGRSQQIVIFGDADFMSNAELKTRRENLRSANNDLLIRLFGELSNGEYPIDVRRKPTHDNDVSLTLSGVKISQGCFYAFSLLLLGAYVAIWIYRRRR